MNQRTSRGISALAAVILAILLGGSSAPAETIDWDNPADGTWNTAANWLPQDVPNEAGEHARFPAGGGLFTTTLDASVGLDSVTIANQDATLAINGSRTLTLYEAGGLNNSGIVTLGGSGVMINGNILNNAAGRVWVPSGMQLDLRDSTVTNNGIFSINPTQGTSNALLRMLSGDVLFDGSGEIILQTAGTPADAQISHYIGSLTQGASHTIRGEGRISAPMTNNGLVEADVPDRELQLITSAKTNNGLMRASGSTLSNTAASFTNNGTIAVADSGLFRTSSLSGNYSGGTLTGGTWQVFEHSTMRLIGGNVQTLAATILLDGLESNLYSDDGTTEALANLQTTGAGGMLEIANGRDFATVGDLTTDFGGITVGDGCLFTINGAYTQIGNEEIPNLAGLTCVNGELTATSGTVEIQGGRLCGSGIIANSVVNLGRVNPGASAGELAIAGDYTQGHDGTCWIELAGSDPGESDHLLIAGEATLSGRLVVTSIESYEPQVGERFTILTCASRSGEFTFETGSPGVGLLYETYYYPQHIEIEITGDPSYVPEPEIAEDTPGAPSDGTEIESDDPFNTPELIPTALNLYSRPLAGGSALLVLDLPRTSQVTLEVFDFSGRRVAVLAKGTENAGRHSYTWSGMTQAGARAASGVYFTRARLQGDAAGDDIVTARVLLTR